MFKLTDPLISLEKSTNVRIYISILNGVRLGAAVFTYAVKVWRQRVRTRLELAKFDPRTLADAGISVTMADFEVSQPFWRPHGALGKDLSIGPSVPPTSKPPMENAARSFLHYQSTHTRDGTPIMIRRLCASDRGHVLDLFNASSQESRYRRFLSPVRSLSEKQLDQLSAPDGKNHLAWLAFEPQGDTLRCVGVARIARIKAGCDQWEFSVSIRDEDHRRGIGAVLMSHVALEAEKRGIDTLYGHALTSNSPMISYARNRGARFALDYPGVYRFSLETRAMVRRLTKAA